MLTRYSESGYHAKRRFAKIPARHDAWHRLLSEYMESGIQRPAMASRRRTQATRGNRPRSAAASTEIGAGQARCSQITGQSHQLRSHRNLDTGAVPNNGPTVASRTAMVVGNLVETAALGLKNEPWWTAACSATRAPRMNLSAHAGATSKRADRCVRGASTNLLPACSGTTQLTRAMLTALTRGPCTWPKSLWIR